MDDEPLARRRVVDLLAAEPDVELVATAGNGPEAVAAIRATRPDVVFLDVQMPGGTGFDVVREVGPAAMPFTVFVTAYDQHALRAFDAAAIDYLVKPFADARFRAALARARQRVHLAAVGQLADQLLAAVQAARAGLTSDPTPPARASLPAPPAGPAYLERIAVETRGRVRVVPVARILYITASGPYAELHTAERAHLIREQMQTLEERLDPAQFLRVHRSAIVRIDLVETLVRHPSGEYTVHLKGGGQLRASRRRAELLEQRLGLRP